MKVVGIDPGVVTGMAVVVDGAYVHGDEVAGIANVIRWLRAHGPDVVVVEDFVLGKPTSHAKAVIEMIGVIKYLSGVPVVMSSPSVLQRALERTGRVHSSPHVRSAATHAIRWYHAHAGSFSRADASGGS